MDHSVPELTHDNWIDVLRQRATETPDREALTFSTDGEGDGHRVDYRTLDARARAVAAALQAACRPGDRVVLLYPPGAAFVAGFLGCLYAGVIGVPAYPPRSAEHERALPRLAGILNDARPAVVLTSTRLLDVVRECVAAASGRDSGDAPACIDTEALPDASAEGWRDPRVGAETVAMLQYTSGSTAAPKGVVLTHANLLHNSAAIRSAFGHGPASRGVIWLPPYHDMGLIGGILQPLFAGFPVTLMPPAAFLQKPIRWLAAISAHRGTTSGGPDFAYDLCVRSIREADRATLDLSSWEVAFTGAEPIRAATLERFAEAFAPCGFRREAFYPCYGLAESTLLVTGGRKLGGATSHRVDAAALAEHRVSTAPSQDGPGVATLVGCGGTFAGSELKIVDPQTSAPCPPGRVGEVWLRGPSVAQGYWNNDTATAASFRNRVGGEDTAYFLRTGDLGFLAADGHLCVTGRLKDLVIIRGRNHYPQDIEDTVASCDPALRGPAGGAAFGVEHGGCEQLVIVHEVDRAHRNADPQPLFTAIRDAVARVHDIGVHAVVLLKPGRLPRTSSGKVQRGACRAAFLAGADLGEVARWVAPAVDDATPAVPNVPAITAPKGASAGELEAWLAAKLAAALQLPASEIEAAEPFARYGLDSAAAVGLAGEIADELGVDLEATLFWDFPSVRALAGHLSELTPESVGHRAA